jgi:hypothetical protein
VEPPVDVRVAQPAVLPVGARVPAEVVVEGAVLHHQHDEGVDRDVLRARQRPRPGRDLRGLGDQGLARQRARHPREAGERRRAGEELPPAEVGIAIVGLEALAPLRVGKLAAGKARRVVGWAPRHGSITRSQS